MKLSVATFIAIGVKQGDAFFMEKRDRRMLVDGGGSVRTFPMQFKRVTNRNNVDVLVCTHNDSDHACGVLGFLRQGLVAKEVWLPASWMDRLSDLISNPEKFWKELVADIEKLEASNVKNLHLLGEMYLTTPIKKEAPLVEENVENLLKLFQRSHQSYPSSILQSWKKYSNLWLLNKRYRLIIEATKASYLIREIVLAAYRSGSSIRWYEYVGNQKYSNSSGGISDFLVPVNAVEVAKIRRRKKSALEYVALTRVNKQSLVFLSPKDNVSPGVLFTADSDLSFYQTIQWHDQMIITAPHHGSENNSYAYTRFIRETQGKLNVIWVRSDRRLSHRPGISYLAASGDKYCTVCRGSRLPTQNVQLAFSRFNSVWQPINTRKCQC
ncbi:MAG: MBL fold metallo-hydrolase [Candidatus Bathycorpusculaceae bacterium]